MRKSEERNFSVINAKFDERVLKILNDLSSKLQQDSTAFMRLIISIYVDGNEGFKRDEFVLVIPKNLILKHNKSVFLKLNPDQFDSLKELAKKHNLKPGPFIRFLIELFCTNKKFRKRVLIGMEKIFSQIELLEGK